MITQTRRELVAKLQFVDPAAKADLLDSDRTNTYVIAALQAFLTLYPKPVTITSVRTDHSNDGCSPHSHASGDAWDMAVDDWLGALAALRTLAHRGGVVFEVGLGGVAKAHDPGGWPADFDRFDDNEQDHIHVSAACG